MNKKISLGFWFALGAVLVFWGISVRPPTDFARRDMIRIKQTSFLVNVNMCIQDFRKVNKRLPFDLPEIYQNYPFVLEMSKQTGMDTEDMIYNSNPNSSTRVQILNPGSRDDLILTNEGIVNRISR